MSLWRLMLHGVLLTSTFVNDGHFERYADDSHQVFSGHQRAQDGTNAQSFAFSLVDELMEKKFEDKLGKIQLCKAAG